MKIRIFALAKELGLDSKELIDYCNSAGIELKPSPLASISPEERDVVLNHIRQQGGTATKVAEPKTLAPVRDESREFAGKLRPIKTVTAPPRPLPSRAPASRTAAVETLPREEEAETESSPTTTATTVAEAEVAEPEVSQPLESTEAEAAEATEAEAVEEPVVEPAAVEEEEAVGERPAVAEAPPREGRPAAEARPARPPAARPEPPERPETPRQPADTRASEPAPADAGPMRRDDYVPASGTAAASGGFREMKARGTIPDSESRHARPVKQKAKPQLPSFAAPPSYKPPKQKIQRPPEEGPAQKPVIPLTPEALEQQSPLSAHLKKHAEQKKKKKRGEEQPAEARGAIKRPDKAAVAPGEGRLRRDKRRGGRGLQDEGEGRGRMLRRTRKRPSGPVALKTAAQIEHPITIRSLSEAMGRPAKELIRSLFQRGSMVTINQLLDEEVALELALEFGVDLEIKRQKTVEEELLEAIEMEDPEEKLASRPPLITILGHVDHGKTTLLDRLRSANVAAGEAGGITQHIASYQVDHNGQKLTFVDTPGHAAFGEMRARGANVTDIVVLVVAANDGVMPQTVECISHAKAAGVPMVVAMNKIDLPETNEQRVLQDLAAQDVLPSEWGGDVEVVRTSALTGQGLDDLLETLLLTAELHEMKANPDRPALGVCLEAFISEGRGVLAWMIVQKGTLRVGDVMLCGQSYGRVRAIYNDRDEELQEAGPSTPVKVAGLDMIPNAGDHFFVVSDLDKAREAAETRRQRGRTEVLARRVRPRTLEDILGAAREGTVQDLPLIIKADTPGSLEALRGEIGKFHHPEVRTEIVHEGVGGVNESDVSLASASGAIIIAFHVVPEDRAQHLAEREGVDVRRYNIIYEVTESIKRTLEGLLIPERREVATGRALVLQTFQISRIGTIAGCRVLNGTIERSHRVHLIRDQKVLGNYGIASLRREKEDVREVREGMECGIRLEGFNDIKPGDLLEAYKVEQVKRTLD